MLDFVHEGANEEEPTSGAPVEIREVGRIGEAGRIESPAFVADHIGRFALGFARAHVHAAPGIPVIARPLFGETRELGLVFLEQRGRQLQIAVVDGVHQGFAQRHADPHPLGAIEQSHARQAPLQLIKQGRDVADVVVELVTRFGLGEAVENLALAPVGARDVEHGQHRGHQLGSELPLGDVVRGSPAESGNGGLLAAVGGHEDHGQRRHLAANGGGELEPVDLGHVQIGHHDVGFVLADGVQRLAAVGGVNRCQVGGLLQQPAGPGAVHGRIVDDEDDRHQAPRCRSA